MDGVESGNTSGSKCGASILVIVLAVALAFGMDPTSAPAQTPSGPSDTTGAAAGPILSGQPVVGTFASPSDVDFFFFYVSAANPGQSSLTIDNLGGGKQLSSGINARVMDSALTPVGVDFGYIIRQGESHTSPIALDPGKYFVEVVTREGEGESYRLTASGDGAFGDYGQIAAQCEAASASLKVVQRQLERARTKLQRAVNRVRRSKYASPETRRAAGALRTRARARVTAKTRSVKTAAEARQPWCFISQ